MKRLEIWQIKRGGRERCGSCLNIFKKGQLKHCGQDKNLRFPNLCLKCYDKRDRQPKQYHCRVALD